MSADLTPYPGDEDPHQDLDEMIRAQERRTAAVRLSSLGVPVAKIAKELGYADALAAHRDINATLREIQLVPAATMRARQVALTQDLLRGCVSQAMAGDTDSINAAVRVINLQADLVGSKAPARHSLAVEPVDFGASAAGLMADLGVTVDVPVPPVVDAGEPWA